jgi:hypothetical protein
MGTDDEAEAGLRPGSWAGAAYTNPSTSQLARDSENTSPNRSAVGPAEALRAGEDGKARGRRSEGGVAPGTRRSEIAMPAIVDCGGLMADFAGKILTVP